MAKFQLRGCAFCGSALNAVGREFAPSKFCTACSNERRKIAQKAFVGQKMTATADLEYLTPSRMIIREKVS